MAQENSVLSEEYFARARELLKHMEEGNQEEVEKLLDELTKLRENSLFRELGRLTREFHEALNSFRFDSRVATLAQKEIPDARERLNYVITMTADAADRTLTAVEESIPACERMELQSQGLRDEWERFRRREMPVEQFRDFSRALPEFFGEVCAESGRVRANLQQVLMAQDFQDLTGQIIRRVITLVDNVESNLVELIRISGQNLLPQEKTDDPLKAGGPPVPGVDKGTVSGQDEVDELLSSLGF